MVLGFAFQNHQFQLLHLSWPQWGQPTCGYNSMPTPSTVTGPSLPERWNTARQVGAGMTGSQWTPRVIRLGTWTRIQSMRSACSSPGQGRVALDLLGQPSEQEPSVLVSVGSGTVVIVFVGVDLQHWSSSGALTLPQLWKRSEQEQIIPFAWTQ